MTAPSGPSGAPARAVWGGDTAGVLRRGVLGLAALGLAGTTLELLFLRHWGEPTRSLVWPGVIALGLAFVSIVRAQRPGAVRTVRLLAAVAALIALTGVGFHVLENLDAGPLDRNFALTWDGLPAIEQLWLATTGGVGPAPVLAPGSLLEVALAIVLATIRHPALQRVARSGDHWSARLVEGSRAS